MDGAKVHICYKSFLFRRNYFPLFTTVKEKVDYGSKLILSASNGKEYLWFLIFMMLLLFPAFFINLGKSPFILDEATRANVAMEMIYSENYITPTINGEFYYNKPPLFNWILILFTKITGNFSEFSFRLPVVLFLFLFAISVYRTLKKEIGRKAALLTSLALITCSRILFYDSFKALIDISFSWIIYLQFWSLYHFFRKNDFYSLFLVSWLFTCLAFLMKGFPALVFQGISLLVLFIMKKEFRRLFSLPHFIGIAAFIAIMAVYFLSYNSYNSIENYIRSLVTESTKRTFLENSLMTSIEHIFTFPFEFISHFIPWSLFVLVLLRKGSLKWLWKQDFARYLILIFSANILVYWFSPAIFARYLIMFLPLYFGLIFHVFYNYAGGGNYVIKFILKPVLVTAAVLLSVGLLIFPFFMTNSNDEYFYLKYSFVILLMIPFLYFTMRFKKEWTLLIVVLLLISRVAFNFFIIPQRIRTGTDEYQKNGALAVAGLSIGKPLYLFENTKIQHVSTYYISRERKEILRRWHGEPSSDYLYIVEKQEAQEVPNAEILFTFETRFDQLKLCLVKISITPDH